MKRLLVLKSLFLSLLLSLGLGFARPVLEVSFDAGAEEALEQIEAALAEQGFSLEQTLDVGLTIRNRGSDFMPYFLAVVSTDDAMEIAIAEDPRLMVFLPVSMVVFEKQEGRTTVAIVDHSRLLSFFSLSPEAELGLSESFEQLYAALANLGRVRRAPGGLTTEPPYTTATLAEESVEDVMFFFASAYQSQNMNQVGQMQFGDAMQEWYCNASYAEAIFTIEPTLGTGAPCRIFAYPSEEGITIGVANPNYARSAFPKAFASDDAMMSLDKILGLNRSVFVEMGVE